MEADVDESGTHTETCVHTDKDNIRRYTFKHIAILSYIHIHTPALKHKHIHIHLHIHMHMHVHVHKQIKKQGIHQHIHACMQAIYIFAYTHTTNTQYITAQHNTVRECINHTCMHSYLHTFVHLYMTCVSTPTHTPTHIYTYTYTCKHANKPYIDACM